MGEKVKKVVQELLESGKIRGFLGLLKRNGHIGPYLFCEVSELQNLDLGNAKMPGDCRYPLNKHLLTLHKRYPEETFGILVRGCDERGLNALFAWNQLDRNRIIPVGIACPGWLAQACQCVRPYPDEFVEGEMVDRSPAISLARPNPPNAGERLGFWLAEFSKCIRCYGCRDICPMCFCRVCSLEDKNLILTGESPPENPIFHLTRALHMAGRCVDCGLCEEACPTNIPLRSLYKKVADIIDQEFNFRPGFILGQKSPFNFLGDASGEK